MRREGKTIKHVNFDYFLSFFLFPRVEKIVSLKKKPTEFFSCFALQVLLNPPDAKLNLNLQKNNLTETSTSTSKRKRSWSRAVFSNLQRKGLEKRFQLQKYITKPDRRQLAATLGLTDAQVIAYLIIFIRLIFPY